MPITKTSENKRKSIFDILEADIKSSKMSEEQREKERANLLELKAKEVNLLIVGATGVGKSSTINALFDTEIAKVGYGTDPETESIECYQFDNMTIYDTPGLGDGVEDKHIRKLLVDMLNSTDEEGEGLIDLVILLLDAASKDLGTAYEMINSVLKPCLGEDAQERIIVALNRADMAMCGRHWDAESNEPDSILLDFLDKKALSVQKRIKETTGINLKPIYFCAGYGDIEGGETRHPYNLSKLFHHIVNVIPENKRLVLADNINTENCNWIHNDNEEDYAEKTVQSFFETINECICEGARTGSELGENLLGIPGTIIGGFVGGAFGAIKGIFKNIFG